MFVATHGSSLYFLTPSSFAGSSGFGTSLSVTFGAIASKSGPGFSASAAAGFASSAAGLAASAVSAAAGFSASAAGFSAASGFNSAGAASPSPLY